MTQDFSSPNPAGLSPPGRPIIINGMKPPEILWIDPRRLHLPGTMRYGADPFKLHRQIRQFGSGTAGMPRIWVNRGSDGALMIVDRVTRATRVARFLPGATVEVEVTEEISATLGHLPTVGDTLP